jgi:4'-phosphopantetheinyl transferase
MPAIHCHHINSVKWIEKEPERSALLIGTDLWRIPVSPHKNFLKLLSGEEIKRSAVFYKSDDAARFITARYALRLMLGKYAGLPAQEIQFMDGPNKKPALVNDPHLHFNVSHSGDWILIGVSARPVGADVERINPGFAFTDVLEDNFSKEEIDFIQRADDPRAAFYVLWTRKESLVKATATGLHAHLPLIPVLEGSWRIDQDILASSGEWSINSFAVADDYLGSVSHDQQIPLINFLELESLFFLQAI